MPTIKNEGRSPKAPLPPSPRQFSRRLQPNTPRNQPTVLKKTMSFPEPLYVELGSLSDLTKRPINELVFIASKFFCALVTCDAEEFILPDAIVGARSIY